MWLEGLRFSTTLACIQSEYKCVWGKNFNVEPLLEEGRQPEDP